MEEYFEQNMPVNPLKLGEAYLEYCVRQGWLTKAGEGQSAQYELTDVGAKKLTGVPFNFDLSKLASLEDLNRKKRKRH